MTGRKKPELSKFAVVFVLLLAWQGASMFYSSVVLPGPFLTGKALLENLSEPVFYRTVALSTLRFASGLILALAVGFVLGLLSGSFGWGRRIISPLVYFIQSVPPILYMTLAMIWFGLNGKATVFIVFIVTMPIMAVNLQEGFANIDDKLIEMGRIFGFSRKKITREIILPSLMSYFKSGLLVMIGLGWKLLIMGEVLSAGSGIGSRITDARMNLETEQVFAWGFVIVFLCLVLQKGFSRAFRLSRISIEEGAL